MRFFAETVNFGQLADKFCIKIYILRNTSDFALITQKNCANTRKTYSASCAKLRKSYKNYLNCAHKILSFRGNPSLIITQSNFAVNTDIFNSLSL